MKLVVGLGNPGDVFKQTPHNIGFMLVDFFLNQYQSNILAFKKKYLSFIYHMEIDGQKFFVVKPQTYMNLSGQAIKKIIDHYRIKIEDILVLNDDIYLKVGCFKFKHQGGHGGHNGLRNIIYFLQTNQFKRLKIGVGYDYSISLEKFVLNPLNLQIKEEIMSNFYLFVEILIDFIKKKNITTFSKKVLNLKNKN